MILTETIRIIEELYGESLKCIDIDKKGVKAYKNYKFLK
jgi:hypothetical protein